MVQDVVEDEGKLIDTVIMQVDEEYNEVDSLFLHKVPAVEVQKGDKGILIKLFG